MIFPNDQTILGGDESPHRRPKAEVAGKESPFHTGTEGDAPSRAWLEVREGERFALGTDCSLGRSRSNHIVLPNEKVSRCHAQIVLQENDKFSVADLGSSNGTWLNGRRVSQPAALFDRDTIQIGPFSLTFRFPGGPERPSVRSASSTSAEERERIVTSWLLLTHHGNSRILPFGRQKEGDTTARVRWLDQGQQIIEQRGGTVSKYLGPGFLAIWQDRTGTHAAVARAITEMAQLQKTLPAGTRLVLHYGSVPCAGTSLGGNAVVSGSASSFLFRMERLAESLNIPLLVSEAAQRRLGPDLPLIELGRHALSGFEGDFLFYRL